MLELIQLNLVVLLYLFQSCDVSLPYLARFCGFMSCGDIDLLKNRKYRSNYNERMLLILAPKSIQERLDERLHDRPAMWRYTAAYAAVNRRWKID